MGMQETALWSGTTWPIKAVLSAHACLQSASAEMSVLLQRGLVTTVEITKFDGTT